MIVLHQVIWKTLAPREGDSSRVPQFERNLLKAISKKTKFDAILSRGTQRNCQKLSECSNPLEIILFPAVSAWSDISDEVRLFHWIPETWQPAQVRHIRPQVGYI
jgi:hypothetical protein